jgi:tRNA (guanine-N7-)-methyltransferase
VTEAERHPQKTLYGRRKGPKSSARQLHLRRTLLPELTLDTARLGDPKSCFAAPVDEAWLEIGFGAGEHLLEQATANPRVGLIGAEVYQSGTDKLLSKLAPEKASVPAAGTPVLDRIRIFEGDGRDVIAALPAASIGKVFLLFPDPWPKTRHHKRRFVQMEMLDELARILKPGGELRLASDDAGYIAWSLERLMAHPAFAWTARGPRDWKMRPDGWPETRYEAKALHGPSAYLKFVRGGRS